MSVINYYGNLVVEYEDAELYIRCFNHIYKELKSCLTERRDSSIKCFLGDIWEQGNNVYEMLDIRFGESLFMQLAGDEILIGPEAKERVINELLLYLED